MDLVLTALTVVGLVLVIEGALTIWRAQRIHQVETMWREAAQLRREAQDRLREVQGRSAPAAAGRPRWAGWDDASHAA